jgi:hypothetical protein
MQPRQEAPWEELVKNEAAPAAAKNVLPRTARRNPISVAHRAVGLPPAAPAQRLGWVIAIAAAIVLGLVLAVAALMWIFGGGTNEKAPQVAEPAVFHVHSRGEKNAAKSITEALARVRGNGKQPARIVVQDDLAENDVNIDVPNVRIEAEEGKTIHWRPAPKSNAANLFRVSGAKHVHIKGFILDGENRTDILVNLYYRCPGAKLENLKLQGFKRYGIWVANCEGGEGAERIQLNHLEFVTSQKEQTDLFFNINPRIPAVSKNRFFAFRDCKFLGDGTPVKTDDPALLENIDWPPNVRPVTGH